MTIQSILTVLVVDDEPPAVERIRALLTALPEPIRVLTCGDGAEAVELIRSSQPDIVFLDIQLPELTGFQVVQAVGPGLMPPVVFVTAHDHFASKAFELEALDYLVKPFEDDRWRLAFERARRRQEATDTAGLRRQLQALVDRLGPVQALDRIAVRLHGRTVIVRVEDIDWLEARDNYVRLHVGNLHYLVRGKISTFEVRLTARGFFRIHRGALVNVDRLTEVRSGTRGEVVVLKSGAQVPVGPSRRDELLRRIGQLA
jgi:two-component system LytT family response regulator